MKNETDGPADVYVGVRDDGVRGGISELWIARAPNRQEARKMLSAPSRWMKRKVKPGWCFVARDVDKLARPFAISIAQTWMWGKRTSVRATLQGDDISIFFAKTPKPDVASVIERFGIHWWSAANAYALMALCTKAELAIYPLVAASCAIARVSLLGIEDVPSEILGYLDVKLQWAASPDRDTAAAMTAAEAVVSPLMNILIERAGRRGDAVVRNIYSGMRRLMLGDYADAAAFAENASPVGLSAAQWRGQLANAARAQIRPAEAQLMMIGASVSRDV